MSGESYAEFVTRGQLNATNPDGNTPLNPEPSMSDVIKDLGLRLESSKQQVETLVIDHLDRPTEN